MTSSELCKQTTKNYWLRSFRLGRSLSTFPADRCAVSDSYREYGRIRLPVPVSSWSRFSSVCDVEGFGTDFALLGLIQILLYRYTLADIITVGIGGDRIAPIRTDLGGSPSVRESLFRSLTVANEANVHATSWAELENWSREASGAANQAAFRVLLSVPKRLTGEGCETELGLDEASRKCDLTITVETFDDQVTLIAEYDLHIYNSETVRRILDQLTFLIESLGRCLGLPIDMIPLWTDREIQSHVHQIAEESKRFSVTKCMHEQFEDAVRRTPDHVAIVMPGDDRRELTYNQVNMLANRLAYYLRGKGVGPDVLVGVYLDRTPELVVAILAILKAGGAYLPVDLSYPRERVALMLADAEAPLIITHSELFGRLPETAAHIVYIDKEEYRWADCSAANPRSGATPNNIIYSIFTSGSTGTPKGALITHANVSRLFDATQAWFQFDEHDTWTLFHSCAFDFSVWELWGPLIYGGRLVIVPFSDSRSPERFHKLLSAEHVTVLNQTPSAFGQLARVDEVSSGIKDLRLVIFGGEALNVQSLRGWFDKYGDAKPQLVNMYGITETTVHVTYRRLRMSDLNESTGSVIGVPIPDLQLYVLDRALQPVPDRVAGEMFVGGAGVSSGYLKREELTAERFLSSPFSVQAGGKLYRTGDLARRLPGGDLEYLGRIDQQVKIRGFRIELGEIESELRRYQGVRDALVVALEDLDRQQFLAAYVVVPSGADRPAVEKLRRALQIKLPDYMVPSAFEFLPEFPLTPHGKVDRAALPPAQVRRSDSQPVLEPQSDLERVVAGVYQDVLHIEEISLDDNFFDIGGTSLRLAQAHERLQKAIGRDFPITDLFAHPSVRGVASHFKGAEHSAQHNADILARAQRQRIAMNAGRFRKV